MAPRIPFLFFSLRILAGSSLEGTQREEEKGHLVLFLEMARCGQDRGTLSAAPSLWPRGPLLWILVPPGCGCRG